MEDGEELEAQFEFNQEEESGGEEEVNQEEEDNDQITEVKTGYYADCFFVG